MRNLFENNIFDVNIDKRKQSAIFNDYDAFVDKFKLKKTTDDCYTPPDIYDCILNFVTSKFNLGSQKIIRPFYPGGDYENIVYPDNCIVIDNPPFSITAKIARFYIDRNIKFFLFAPHLTLFGANIDCTAVVCGADITYENGAKVKTSFLSNLLGDIRVCGMPDLYKELNAINERKKIFLPKYRYPDNLLTVSMVQKYVESGIYFEIDKNEVHHCKVLDSQKIKNKSIFGAGFLLSHNATAAKLAAHKAAVDKLTANKATVDKIEEDNTIVWELSEREKYIIDSLG